MMWKNRVINDWYKALLVLVIVAGVFFRMVGVNWDEDQHLHPDERFMTMVGNALRWPTTISNYFDTTTSTLNPHNQGFGFYVYGTWPVIFVKWLAGLVGMDTYSGITLVGRRISAILDVGVLLVVMAIVKKVFSTKTALWAGAIYACAVLPIQLAHYFATDPYAVLFLMLSFYFLIDLIRKPNILKAVFLGVCFGLALAAKVSSVVFVPTLILGFAMAFVGHLKKFFSILLSGIVFGFFAYLLLRLAMPYLFADNRIISWTLNPKVMANLKELKSYDTPAGYFPPATMWVHAKDYVFPLENMAFWGWGIPLFALGLVAMFMVPLKTKNKYALLTAFAILSIFVYQGMQYAKPMRYFYVLYPLMAILSGVLAEALHARLGPLRKIIFLIVGVIIVIWPYSFVSIYRLPNSRVLASKWIYENIPHGTRISCEHWDDCLPLNLENYPGNGSYEGIEFTMFYPDTDVDKWKDLVQKLQTTDYIILSSNRVYGSTMTVPEKYPINNKYYQALFSGNLGFAKVAEFTSRPSIKTPKLTHCFNPPFINYGKIANTVQDCVPGRTSFVDDYADESFTVYDHPKVIIFKKLHSVNYSELLGISQ